MRSTDILIVGGGPAGILAGLAAKQTNPSLKILMVKNEKGITIRCSEPYTLGGKACLNKIIHSDDGMLKKNGLDYLIDEVVDFKNWPQEKVAITKKGEEIKFQKLVLATGAEPFVPPIKRIKEFPNIFTLRRASDVRKIKKQLAKAKQVVVIGGGAIGIETAALLQEAKKKVTLLEAAPYLMAGAYDPDYSQKAQEVLEKNKVKVVCNAQIKEIKAKEIVLAKETIKYGLIICACGVRGNVELAKKLGCKIERFGIKINNQCLTTKKDVYAVGDCAQAKSLLTKKPLPSQLATTAVIMGKVAGLSLAGKKACFAGVLNPAVSCFFDKAIGRVGMTEKEAKENKIKIKTASAQATDQYPTQPTVQPIENKLIFDAKTNRLIGAQVFGGKKGVGLRINLLSLAIANKLTAEKLAQLNYCAHPEETPLPFMEPIVMAAEQILFS